MLEEGGQLGNIRKWPLPTRWIAASLSVLIVAIIFFYPVFPGLAWHSVASWTWAACNSYNGFLHGRLVPLVFPWMLWLAWQRSQDDVVKPSIWGLTFLLTGLLFFLAAMRSGQPRVALFGFPLVVLGLVQFWFGLKIARAVILPAFFLWFMIPVPGFEALISGYWAGGVAWVSCGLGQMLGMDLTISGANVELDGGRFLIAEG